MSDLYRPIHRLTAVLPELLDPTVGIINTIFEHPREADSPSFFRFNAKAASTKAFGEFQNFAIGGGAATNRKMAVAKTVGECLERYSPAIYDVNQFRLSSYRNADFDCVHPDEFALYSPFQYEHEDFMFDPFTVDSPIRWVAAKDLSSNQDVHVPAVMVYLPYFFYRNGEETPIIQPISTGLSCHCSFEESAIGGICEVIERDCFTITWQAKMSRDRINIETLDAKNADLVQRFTDVGYEIYLMDISNETRVPGVLAVARHTRGYPVPLAVAASVATSPSEACQKALEELAHTERYAFQIKTEIPPFKAGPEWDEVNSQVRHVGLWLDPNLTREAAFLWGSEKVIDLDDMDDISHPNPRVELKQLVDRIADSGYQVLVTDVTTEDLADLGFHVTRAIIPGYHPLFMGYHNRATGGKRLWSIPQKLGFPGINRESGDFPFPHPFP